MIGHTRYLQQAAWTRDLRNYLFEKAGLKDARHVLEVGCGTGAILCELNTPAALHGLDLESEALTQCRIHAASASLTRADAHFLPYPDQCFDIVFCHFLLLWVKNPLQVVCEMARVGRVVIAFAEPDYSQRVDEPPELSLLGEWQTQALTRQGANPFFGGQLAETFHQAGIKLEETGPIQMSEAMRSDEEWEGEWAVIRSDLAGLVADVEIEKMKVLDAQFRQRGERRLYVPTFFAWGKTGG